MSSGNCKELWRDWVKPKDDFYRHLHEKYLGKKINDISELQCVFCEEVSCIDTACLVRVQTNFDQVITNNAVGNEYKYEVCCEKCYDRVMKIGDFYLWSITKERFEEAKDELRFIDIKEPDIEQEDWSRRGKIDL